jgi:hypothetical protein
VYPDPTILRRTCQIKDFKVFMALPAVTKPSRTFCSSANDTASAAASCAISN